MANLRGLKNTMDTNTLLAYNDPAFALGRLISLGVSNAMQKNYDNRALEKGEIIKQAEQEGWADMRNAETNTLKEWQELRDVYGNKNSEVNVDALNRAIGNSDTKASPIITASGTSVINTGNYGDLNRLKASGKNVIDISPTTVVDRAIEETQPSNYVVNVMGEEAKKNIPSTDYIGRATDEGQGSNYVINVQGKPAQITDNIEQVGSNYVTQAINASNPTAPTEVVADESGNVAMLPAGTAKAQYVINAQGQANNLQRAIDETQDRQALAVASGDVESTPQEKAEAQNEVRDKVVERSQTAKATQVAQQQGNKPFSAKQYLSNMDTLLRQGGVQEDIRAKLLNKWTPQAVEQETQQAVTALNSAWGNNPQEYIRQVARLAEVNPTVAKLYEKGIIDQKDLYNRTNALQDKAYNAQLKQQEMLTRGKIDIYKAENRAKIANAYKYLEAKQKMQLAQEMGMSQEQLANYVAGRNVDGVRTSSGGTRSSGTQKLPNIYTLAGVDEQEYKALGEKIEEYGEYNDLTPEQKQDVDKYGRFKKAIENIEQPINQWFDILSAYRKSPKDIIKFVQGNAELRQWASTRPEQADILFRRLGASPQYIK